MMREVRCPVRILPRHLPGHRDNCMGREVDCPQPCQWVPQYAGACGRRCDCQIRHGYRPICPMWQMFKVNDTDTDMSLFPHHNVTYDVDAGLVTDPNGGLVCPMRISFRDRDVDREVLRSLLSSTQYGDRHADSELAMELLQDQLNTANERHIRSLRDNRTPPPEAVTSFVYPLREHGHAKATYVSHD